MDVTDIHTNGGFMKRALRIAMDFNGCTVDVQLIKQKTAYLITGNLIDPNKLKREIAVPEGLLTNEQYTRMIQAIYSDLNLILQAEPVPGSIHAIQTLVKEDHQVDIITASNEDAYRNAIAWCKDDRHKIDDIIRLFGVGINGQKSDVTDQIDIILEDEVAHLRQVRDRYVELGRSPPILMLLERPYNTHEGLDGDMERIRGFHHFINRVRVIARHLPSRPPFI